LRHTANLALYKDIYIQAVQKGKAKGKGKGKGRLKVTRVYIAPSRETSKALSH